VHSEVLRPASLAAFSDDSRTGTCAAAVLREAGTCAAATAVNWDGEPESSFRSFPVCAPSATGEGLFMNVLKGALAPSSVTVDDGPSVSHFGTGLLNFAA